jgi:hypothetical protein
VIKHCHAKELDERLRLHSPRANDLELNVSDHRKTVIEAKKLRLEKHFRTLSKSFNHGFQLLTKDLTELVESLSSKAASFSQFHRDLSQADSQKALEAVQVKFRQEEKAFGANLQGALAGYLARTEDFAKSFHSANGRFLSGLDGSTSAEERELTSSSIGKIDSQITAIVSKLSEQASASRSELEEKLRKVSEEFEGVLPAHEADVKLVSDLADLMFNAKLHFDTLLFKNSKAEIDTRRSVAKIAEARAAVLDHQGSIERQFEAIEDARIALIQRAKYLSAIRAEFPVERKKFWCDFQHVEAKAGTPQKSSQKQDPTADRRKARPVSLQAVVRKKSEAKDPKAPPPSKYVERSLLYEIEAMGVYLIQKARVRAKEYYHEMKMRKGGITRRDKIPGQIKDFIDQVRAKLSQIIIEAAEINEVSAEELSTTVTEAHVSSRASLSSMWEHFHVIYFEQIWS